MNEVVTLIEGQRSQFLKVVSDRTIEFDREAGFALQILQGNDYLCKIALANKPSLQAAVTNVAAIGISLNPASKLAYLIPRKGAVCLDISYMGLLHIAQQCGAIQWGQAVLVREHDTFKLRGIDKEPEHSYEPFAQGRGALVGVYVVVKTDTGDYLTHTMPIADVWSIRDRSEAWKAYVADNKKKCPWVTDEGEMVKKTCVKQASKYWPRRERLDAAVHHMNTDGGEGITVEPEKMADEEYQGFLKRLKETTTKDAAKVVWHDCLKICEELGDVGTAKAMKAELIAHGEFIDKAAAKEKAETE